MNNCETCRQDSCHNCIIAEHRYQMQKIRVEEEKTTMVQFSRDENGGIIGIERVPVANYMIEEK